MLAMLDKLNDPKSELLLKVFKFIKTKERYFLFFIIGLDFEICGFYYFNCIGGVILDNYEGLSKGEKEEYGCSEGVYYLNAENREVLEIGSEGA